MPRHKKNADILKLEGGYRKDRHANRDEHAVATIINDVPACPASITHKSVIAIWELVMPELVHTGRVAQEDIPELEIAFRALQDIYQLREVQDKFRGGQLLLEQYSRIMTIIHKREERFIQIMGLYGISSQKRLDLLGAGYMAAKAKKSLAEKMTE